MNERHGVFLVMMPSAYMALRLFEVEPLLRIAVQAVFAIVALAGVAWAFARSEDCDLKFAILAVGPFLASPYSFNYDMPQGSLAVALPVMRGLRGGFPQGGRGRASFSVLMPGANLRL